MTIEIRVPKTKIKRSNVKRLEATMSDGRVGSFELELFMLPRSDLSLYPRGHTSNNWLEIFRHGKNVFGDGHGFFIEDVRRNRRGGGTITGRSYEVLLADEKTYNFGTSGGDVAVIAKHFLSSSSKVSITDADIDDPSETISRTFTGESYLEALQELAFLTQRWFYVKRYGDNFRGFFKADRGDGSASSPKTSIEPSLNVATNLGSTGGDCLRIINRQRVVGKRSSSIDYTYNNIASQTLYGVFEGDPIYDDDITSESEASNRADQIFATYADPQGDAIVETDEYVEGIYLGDYVLVQLAKQEDKNVMQPVEITVIFEAGKRDTIKIDFDFSNERLDRLVVHSDKKAWKAGTNRTDIDYGGLGKYWIDTGWLQSANGLDDYETTASDCAACGCGGGQNCPVGVTWGDAFSYTIPTTFGATNNVYMKAIYRTLDGGNTLYSTCHGAENNTDTTELYGARWCNETGDFSFSGSEAGDHGGDTYYIGMTGGTPAQGSIMARYIVGWN